MSKTSEWQSWRCGVVLREVFAWLGGCELARAGAVCRAWCIAAAEPSLWRRLLLSERLVEPAAHKYLCDLRTDSDTVSWRQEYMEACGGWELVARHTPAGGATLLHAALAPSHDVLAIGADDASLAVWRHIKGSWREVWRTELRPRGWAGVARVEWARRSPRLLLAGPRALIDDWELMVVDLDDDYSGGTIASRVRCSAGAAGCWADLDGDTFLSLELQLLAPGLACTTVRLNAATQETQSEYAGVTSALLRIFNEDRAHITHVLVASLEGRRILVGGTAFRLASWPVAAPRPPPLLVGAPNELAERVRRHRARLAQPEQEVPVPDEEAVRALCAPPDREWRLSAPLVGLAIDDSARWLWAACSDGSVTRVCVRELEPRLCVRAPLCPPRPPAHYIQPASNHLYVASPEGGYSPRVWIWSLRSGAASQCGGERPPNAIKKYENEHYRDNNSFERNISNHDSDNRLSRGHMNGENVGNIDHEGGSDDREVRSNGSTLTDSINANNVGYSDIGDNRDDGIIGTMSDNIAEHSSNSGTADENGSIFNGASRSGLDDESDSKANAANGSGLEDAGWREIESASVSQIDGVSQSEVNAANGSGIEDAGWSEIESASASRINGVSESKANAASESEINDGSWSEAQIASGSGIETNTASGSAVINEIRNGINDRNTVNGANGSDSDSASGSAVIASNRTGLDASGRDIKGVSGSGSGRGWRREYHSGAAVCALLPSHDPASLHVLAADTLYIWRRRATRQSSPSLFYD